MRDIAYLPDQPTWLRAGLIYLANHGSHAYGTASPQSDVDIKGVAIPPAAYFLGFASVFEQTVSSTPVDLVVYGIRKFMHLAADCNPSIIEVLWVDERDILFMSEAGKTLREHRANFLSRKAVHTFSGYAIGQLKRIKTHRKWLLDPPKAPPTRAEFGLEDRKLLKTDDLGAIESMIRGQIEAWDLDLSMVDDATRLDLQTRMAQIIADRTTTTAEEVATRRLGFDDNMMVYVDKERRFKTAQNHWEQYQTWRAQRNEVRAALEAKHGYDTKHAMHLVRLLRMCREVLTERVVHVRRPDAAELLAIRNGFWSYNRLVEFAEREDAALHELAKTSVLPRAPDRAFLDQLCMGLVSTHLGLRRDGLAVG